MYESILAEVRSACNLESTDTTFDKQLIPLVNGQIMMAHQFGIGPSGFVISGSSETWYDWLGEAASDLAAVKIWLPYSVLLLFDPPDNGTVLKAYQEQITKIEWMLREKSEEKGYVATYVPEKADFYGVEVAEDEEEENPVTPSEPDEEGTDEGDEEED